MSLVSVGMDCKGQTCLFTRPPERLLVRLRMLRAQSWKVKDVVVDDGGLDAHAAGMLNNIDYTH